MTKHIVVSISLLAGVAAMIYCIVNAIGTIYSWALENSDFKLIIFWIVAWTVALIYTEIMLGITRAMQEREGL